MNTVYYKSQKGDINTEAAWKQWLEEFWADMQRASSGYTGVTRPRDSWERTKKVLRLEQVDFEEGMYLTSLTMPRTYWGSFNNEG